MSGNNNPALQSSLSETVIGAITEGETRDCDFVFVIDGTESMVPVIETVKDYCKNFYAEVEKALFGHEKKIGLCRVKIIVYRDYYCDGSYAMDETDFYVVPDENEALNEYLSGIEAKGGGDLPENGLEALALAMRSDWSTGETRKRHIIVMFTDAPAHPLEDKRRALVPDYPYGMLESYDDLYTAWSSSQGICDGDDKLADYRMNSDAERLILFAPDMYPWSDVVVDFEHCVSSPIVINEGGAEIRVSTITDFIGRSSK